MSQLWDCWIMEVTGARRALVFPATPVTDSLSLIFISLCIWSYSWKALLGGNHVIPMNTDNYIAFQWQQFWFIDSLAFLNTSLDKLVKSTPVTAFHHTPARFPVDGERSLTLRKGVYPSEYLIDFAKIKNTQLPPQEAFFSTLTDSVSITPWFSVHLITWLITFPAFDDTIYLIGRTSAPYIALSPCCIL